MLYGIVNKPEQQLEPCPWCKTTDHLVSRVGPLSPKHPRPGREDAGDWLGFIECDHCFACGPKVGDTKNTHAEAEACAVSRWNAGFKT